MPTKVKPPDTELLPLPDQGRPYILESSEFDKFVFSKRNAAQREIDELDLEIGRLQTEAEARMARRQDLMRIVIKADAILDMTDITPNLVTSERS
jgi:hypothetical protein